MRHIPLTELPPRLARVGILDDEGRLTRWSHIVDACTDEATGETAVALANGEVHPLHCLCAL